MDEKKTAYIKSGITRKIFTRPRPNDRYHRLSKMEQKFIRQNAGLTALELEIFSRRCEGLSFDEISHKTGYHISYCKKIAGRIEKMIAALISDI